MAKQVYFIQYTPLPHRQTAGRDQPTDPECGRSQRPESPSGHTLQLSGSPTHHQTDDLSGESWLAGIKSNQLGPNPMNTAGGAAHSDVLFGKKLPNKEGVMRGRIIEQQAPGLERMQIQPYTRDPFQQLVEHTFVEVCIHCLPRRNKLSESCCANQKTQSTSSSRAIFVTAVFMVSETPGPSIPHSVT